MKAILYFLGLSASATFGFILCALFRGGGDMDDYSAPCGWLEANGLCENLACPACDELCPCGKFAPLICEHYERGDADADR